MKFFSMFSGIGAPEKALKNKSVDIDLVGYCEIDKYASKSYSAVHGVPESMNLGDITKVDEKLLPKDIDLMVYGFPCQDISLSGRQKGLFNEDGTQTRSGLFFEALRIIKESQPKVAIAENVKNLVGKKFKEQFNIVLSSLEDAGYNNYWKILNAKDYGVPQNRERVFIVSIRKDIDNGTFEFIDGFPLTSRLKDVLEPSVDEKYFVSETALKGFIEHKERNKKNGNGFGFQLKCEDDIAPTIRARYYKDGSECLIVSEPKVQQIGNCYPSKTRDNPNQGRVYDTDGLSPTLNCMGGGNRQPFIIVKEATKLGYAEAVEGDSINLEHPNSKTRRGRVGKQVAQTLTTAPQQAVVVSEPTAAAMRGRYNEEGRVEQHIEISDRPYANAITTVQKDSLIQTDLRIRKLTPKECWRLQGFDDSDFEKAEKVNSNTQLYKQAGNSIAVPVIEYIYEALFKCGVLTK